MSQHLTFPEVLTRPRAQQVMTTIVILVTCVIIATVIVVSPLIALALAFGASYVALSLISARVALSLWIGCICLVPAWLGIFTGGYFWEMPSLICIATLPAVLAHREGPFFTIGDSVPYVFLTSCVVASLLSTTPVGQVLDILAQGALPYLVARHLAPVAGLDWMYRTFSIVLAVVAALAIFEYAANWHPFVGLYPASPIGFWSDIQLRGGVVRSEVTFGHAIALGAALSMAVPLALGSSFQPRTKVILLSLFGLAILSTASRGPILAGFLGILLTVILTPRGARSRGRTRILIVTGMIGVIFATTLASRFAGSEAANSASYRSDLYDQLVPTINAFGLADSFTFTGYGVQTFQGFTSIDSTVLQIGMLFGWIPLAIAGFGMLLVAFRALSGRMSPPGIALLSQIPLLASVWLIAQYLPLMWFLIGLVVAAGMESPARRSFRSEARRGLTPGLPAGN